MQACISAPPLEWFREQSFPACPPFRFVRGPISVSECFEELRWLSNKERPYKMRFAHNVPHNASRSSDGFSRCMSDLSHEVLDRVLHVRSVRCQMAQHTNETAQPQSQRFINRFICATSFDVCHRKRWLTFRSSTVKFISCLACAESADHMKLRLCPFQRIVRLRKKPSFSLPNLQKLPDVWFRSDCAASHRS